jgi:dTDP-4-dehydrorhamnose reductase
MSPKKIIVTGSGGQLGSELKDLSATEPFQFIFFDRTQLDIHDPLAVQKAFQEHEPHYLINCAAYTAVDKAENEEALATEINGTAVGNLAAACHKSGSGFIHISTDYVFSGDQQNPLKETDATQPVNAYGRSKLKGEQLAFENNPASIVLRASWLYSSYGKNFVKSMLRLMEEKASIGVVNDQFGSPTYAADLAEAILLVIRSGKWVPGIYNYSNEGVATWFDLANEVRRLTGASCTVLPITTAQYPTPAKRPKYSVLDKAKIRQTFSVPLKDWKDSLQRCLDKIKGSAAG